MPSTRSDSAPRRSSRASELEKKKQQDEKKKLKSTTSKKASATKSKPAAPSAPVKKQVKQAVKKTAAKVEKAVAPAPPPAQKRGPPKQREALPTKEEKEELKNAAKETATKGKKVVKETANKLEEKVTSPNKSAGVYKEGDVVEDIVLKNDSDEEVHLENLYKDQGIVIFTYPKASTPGCTTQSCKYRDIASSFETVNYKIYGLSRDSPKAQSNWKTKNNFKYDLLCDPDSKLMKRLGCTDSVRRAHFIIEKGGKLLEAKVGVKPADDADNALEFIKSLSGDKEEEKSE
ncbi:hypothetical protein JCM5353_006146 [Sporobolomyces roseus]